MNVEEFRTHLQEEARRWEECIRRAHAFEEDLVFDKSLAQDVDRLLAIANKVKAENVDVLLELYTATKSLADEANWQLKVRLAQANKKGKQEGDTGYKFAKDLLWWKVFDDPDASVEKTSKFLQEFRADLRLAEVDERDKKLPKKTDTISGRWLPLILHEVGFARHLFFHCLKGSDEDRLREAIKITLAAREQKRKGGECPDISDDAVDKFMEVRD
jgi:hypothetical protein